MHDHGKRQLSPISIAKYEHGLNDALTASDIGELYFQRYPRHHCVKCNNVTLHNMKHRPGTTGLNYAISGRGYGLHFFGTDAGTEILLAVVGQKLYSVDINNGTLTEKYDFGGAGEAYFETWNDKCWICNGQKVVKVENTGTAYQVGITPPSGVTAAKSAGAGLPDGTYKVYVSYARKVSGTNVLYSRGQSIADVILGGGDNRITFTFANSTDAQVNNKVVWMTDAGGTVYYFYYETGDNTTTSFIISSASAKNTNLLYTIDADTNYVPGAFQRIHAFDNRLWGVIDNIVYYSYQYGTLGAYELERFRYRSELYCVSV